MDHQGGEKKSLIVDPLIWHCRVHNCQRGARSNLKGQVPWYTMILSKSDLAEGQMTPKMLDGPGPTFSFQYTLQIWTAQDQQYTEFVMV
jgi:hypothetical protein